MYTSILMNVLAFSAPRHEVTQVFLTGTTLNTFFSKKGIFTCLAAVFLEVSRHTLFKIKGKKKGLSFSIIFVQKGSYLVCSHLHVHKEKLSTESIYIHLDGVQAYFHDQFLNEQYNE